MNSLEILNNKNLLSLNKISLEYLINEGHSKIFFQEIINRKNLKMGAKIRQFQANPGLQASMKKQMFPQAGHFKFVRCSLTCRFLALVSTMFANNLFVLDLNTDIVLASIRFEENVSSVYWKSDDVLVVLCSNNTVYFWNQNSIFIAEKYYQEQVSFSKMNVSVDEKVFIFSDKNKICIFNQN